MRNLFLNNLVLAIVGKDCDPLVISGGNATSTREGESRPLRCGAYVEVACHDDYSYMIGADLRICRPPNWQGLQGDGCMGTYCINT